jgi:hypothetical protein
MKAILLAGGLSLAMISGAMIPGPAQAGCVGGAVVGGVAGHLAHHHALAGAAVGCVVGHEMAVHKKKEQRLQREDARRHWEETHHH